MNLLIECARVIEDDSTSDNMKEEYSILIKIYNIQLWLMSDDFPVIEEDRREAFDEYSK